MQVRAEPIFELIGFLVGGFNECPLLTPRAAKFGRFNSESAFQIQFSSESQASIPILENRRKVDSNFA